MNKVKDRDMREERSTVKKMQEFFQAFSEFLGRPKTIFDIKDRLKLLVLLLIIIAVLEAAICYVNK